jgi:hypothetical protein
VLLALAGRALAGRALAGLALASLLLDALALLALASLAIPTLPFRAVVIALSGAIAVARASVLLLDVPGLGGTRRARDGIGAGDRRDEQRDDGDGREEHPLNDSKHLHFSFARIDGRQRSRMPSRPRRAGKES